MNISHIAKLTEKFVIDNSPTLLATIGAIGTIATGYLAAKGGLEAGRILEQTEIIEDLTSKQKVEICWKRFMPAAGMATATVVTIMTANHIGTRRAAGIAAAYSITERAYDEYRRKVSEKFGENKTQAVRDEIAQDQVNRNPPPQTLIISGNKSLCRDAYSDRYFESTIEDLKAAQNLVNYRINNGDSISLSEFYDAIGIPHTQFSDEIGWSSSTEILELSFSGTISPDGRPCISFEYRVEPVRSYDSCWG